MFSLQRLLLQSKKHTEILIGISLAMQMAHSAKAWAWGELSSATVNGMSYTAVNT